MTEVSIYTGPAEPALSWSAIVAGALVALSTSIFLTVLASGLGFELSAGALASRRALDDFTPEIGAGAVAIQVLSAGLGGYLAGRLRHVWTSAHTDEAHFRDTAHGLIVWAVATLAGVALYALVIAPYVAQLGVVVANPSTLFDPVRTQNIAVQSAFFAAMGMLLGAFAAAVAGRIGGLHTEHMHRKGRA